MTTEMLISSDPWENRVAILENGSLAEIYIEREEKVIGSIYKGRVKSILPGMGASFVDIGTGENAFLYVGDINRAPLNIGEVEITQSRSGWTISERVNRGDEVLVQIVKEPRGLKGARVSTNISLPGRYLVLTPNGRFSGVSRKIESAAERDRLKSVMQRIRPEGMATIVRTAAAGVSDAELIADLGVLIRMWHGILETYKTASAPALIHKDMNLIFKAARDFITPEVERVLIDDPEEHEKLRDFMRLLGPQYVERIGYYPKGRALFSDYKIDEQLSRLMKPTVPLPSGGSIVIETTEALTVIDVNSGRFAGGKTPEDTIVHTNVEAATEIARQVRLRDIGGIIVCDFIDMHEEASRNKVLAALETGLRRDRTRTTLRSFSALGLLEFTRKRIGKDLSGQLRSSCPTCRGLGTVLSPESVAIACFRSVRAFHQTAPAKEPITIVCGPMVATQIRFWYHHEFAELAAQIERPLHLHVDAAMHPEQTRLVVGPYTATASVTPRVGDELELELLTMKLPNPSSAIATLAGRLIEVEQAAHVAGGMLTVRILDVDEEHIIAEPRHLPSAPTADGRRRRRGRPAPAEVDAEQTEALRLLAEEAERALATYRTAAQDHAEQHAASSTAPPRRTPAPPRPFTPVAATPATGTAAPTSVVRVADGVRVRTSLTQSLEPTLLPDETRTAVDEDETGTDAAPRRRRRRRRRRGGRGAGGATPIETGGISPSEQVPLLPHRAILRVDSKGATESTGSIAPEEPSRALTPWRPRRASVALEAPPPSLSVPQDTPLIARPTPRRRAPRPLLSKPPAELTATQLGVLPPAPPPAPTPSIPTPTEPAIRRPRLRRAPLTPSSASLEGAVVTPVVTLPPPSMPAVAAVAVAAPKRGRPRRLRPAEVEAPVAAPLAATPPTPIAPPRAKKATMPKASSTAVEVVTPKTRPTARPRRTKAAS